MASCDLRVPMLILSMVGVSLVALRTVIVADWLSSSCDFGVVFWESRTFGSIRVFRISGVESDRYPCFKI
jgi:hypothetical protein